jgi:hypothetical protein
MEPSALESVSRSLESSLDHWGWLILASTAIVVLGLVVEYWEPIAEFIDEWRRPAAAFPWRKFIELAGGILVTVGVAGELGFTYKASRTETKLRDNNHRIEESLNISAESAARAADRAKQSAEKANTVAGEALGKSEGATNTASAADTRAKSVETKANELNGRLSTTGQKIDSVETKRAELEKSLKNLAVCNSPRVIPVWSVHSRNGASKFNDPLLPFKGWNALIEYVPNDAETQRAASSLAMALQNAGWDVSLKPSPKVLRDGVEVQGFEPDFLHGKGDPDVQSARLARDTAAIVVKFLHSYNWKADLGWMDQDDVTRQVVPRNGILIQIGLYPPTWFVAPPAMKGWSAAMTQSQKERDEAEQKAEHARKDSNAKILSQQNPRLAEIFKKDFEVDERRQEQERKNEMQIRSSPCQPLETLGPY